MVVSNTTSKVTYTGNGSTDTYAFAFKIFKDLDLVVTKVTIATGDEEILALGTDYTVLGAGDDDGGSVVLTAGNLTSSYRLVIQRILALTQDVDYTPSDKFPAETHEEALDRSIMISQQLKEQVDRCVQSSVGGEVITSEELIELIDDAADSSAASQAAQAAAEHAQSDAEAAQAAAEHAQADAEAAQAAAVVAQNSAIASRDTASAQAVIATAQAGLAATARIGAEAAQDAAEHAQGDAEAAQAAAEHAQSDAEAAQAAAEDNATVASGSAASVTSMYAAVSAAQAQANALLGLGIGGSSIDGNGNLIMTYNAATVTSIEINAGGELVINY